MKPPPFKLHNVVLMYDFYIVAEDRDDAIAVAKQLVATEPPTDFTIYDDLARPNDIMASWRSQKPYVSNRISEAAYQAYEGSTTAEFLMRFLEKR